MHSLFASLFWFLWFICWMLSIDIGLRKNETVKSFFLGLFFGPLGLIFVLLIKRNKKQCLYCREWIDKNAVICPHCRKDIVS